MKESDTFRLDFPTAINTDRAESHQRPSRAKPSGLPIIHGRAAGIDIGSRFHVVAVSPDLCDEPVQTFQAFTSDLVRLADWLISLGIETVAMESTGVYWVAAFEVLESKGLNVILANAREARAVPGRKSDVNDAQWLQRLHACGLLRASFRPGREIAALRVYLRARERHLDYAAAHIQHMQKALTVNRVAPEAPLPKAKHRTKQPNEVNFNVRAALYQLTGTDLTQIHGVGPFLALRLIAECGTDLSRWKSAKHFTSWLTLAPGCKISGGKVLSAHTRKTSNRVTAHLRLAAVTVGRTNTALGAFYRRLAGRIGNAKAVTATARKIAVLFYNAMRFGMAYKDPGTDQYEMRYRDRVIKQLHRRAAEFGFALSPQNTENAAILDGVS